MKIMKKILLIHWYFFTYELIELEKINFLTGKNASGKSTVIDALQLLFLADTSGNFFNKAANGKGDRTLAGYLKGEYGEDDESGYKSVRGGKQFSSYICVEFYDDIKKTSMTAGCCFDYFSENDYQHTFFLFDDALPKNQFLQNGEPMSRKTLKRFLKEGYGKKKSFYSETNKEFKEQFYARLGGLPMRFGALLRKAVPFNPITDIQKFITEFVCEEHENVDISPMQQSIRSYKNLEKESQKLEAKILYLQDINKNFDEYRKYEDSKIVYSYLIDRANFEINKSSLDKALNTIKKLTNELSGLDSYEKKCFKEKNILNDEYTTKVADLKNDSVTQTKERLDRERAEKEAEVKKIIKEFEHYKNVIDNAVVEWKRKSEEYIQLNSDINTTIFDAILSEKISLFSKEVVILKEMCSSFLEEKNFEKSTREELTNLLHNADAIGDNLILYKENTTEELGKTRIRQRELEKEYELLQKGRIKFPEKVVQMQDLLHNTIKTEHHIDSPVKILAEEIEIKDDRWRNVIEGYLNTQKHYLLVEPQYYKECLIIYNKIKKENNIFGIGLININELKKKNYTHDENSLAEEIQTDNQDARLYVDYVLGRVMKCQDVSQLEKFHISITDTGMLYKGYVARKMDPDLWKSPTIGKKAVEQKLVLVGDEIKICSNVVNTLLEIKTLLLKMDNLTKYSMSEIEQTLLSIDKTKGVKAIQSAIKEIENEIDGLDLSHIFELKKSIDELKVKISEKEKEVNEISQKIGRKMNEKDSQEKLIPNIEKEIDSAEKRLKNSFDSQWVEKIGNLRYMKEHDISKKTNEEISQNFKSPLGAAQKNAEDCWTKTRDSRRNFVGEYKLGFDIEDRHLNEKYENLYLELSEIKLPEYKEKIEDARNKTFEQFQEDFLSRLQSNIQDTQLQIKNLNEALKSNPFGGDTYQFKIVPKDDYKNYYDMITSDMLLRGYNILSEQFNEKYKYEIQELFSLLTTEERGTQEDYDRKVEELTNYRTYLNFDLEVKDGNGDIQKLSRTIGKKSGGETQTPFYIAVLASFAQIYRIGRGKNDNTARIIIFDEAFSKMDGDRIIQSIELLRKFDFQVILSAPPEKIGDLATLVDKNLCVIRDNHSSFIKPFTPQQIGDVYEAE